MLYVIRGEQIVFRIDAWRTDCMEEAIKYIAENGLEYLDQKINLNGDMLIFCE